MFDSVESAGEVAIRVMKFDGTEYRRWRATLTRKEGALLVFDAAFEDEVRHSQLGLIRRGTASIEYYWLDRWYNVFRFLEPDGRFRNFYCNVNMPPVFDGGTLTYVDLDIDVLVHPDLSYQILDLEEFEMNAKKYNYPQEVQACARSALQELLALIESHEFPFDHQE